jgi:hypothetical protein
MIQSMMIDVMDLAMNGDSYRLKQSAGRRRAGTAVAADQSQAIVETADRPGSI